MCLASDHLVSSCRDPVKCHYCRRIGHHSFESPASRTTPSMASSVPQSHSRSFNSVDTSLLRGPAEITRSHLLSAFFGRRSSPDAPLPSGPPIRRDFVEVHVDTGDFEEYKRFAVVNLEVPVHSPFRLIREAMENLCGAPSFCLAAAGWSLL